MFQAKEYSSFAFFYVLRYNSAVNFCKNFGEDYVYTKLPAPLLSHCHFW